MLGQSCVFVCVRLLLEVGNTKAGLTTQGRRMVFTKVAFSCHGNWFVAGDQLGQVYQFDLTKNRYVSWAK